MTYPIELQRRYPRPYRRSSNIEHLPRQLPLDSSSEHLYLAHFPHAFDFRGSENIDFV